MRQIFALLAASFIIGNYTATAQNRNSVKLPNEIADALVREDESVRSCIESSGGVSKTFRAESIDLSKDDSPEIMVRGLSPCVCGPRRCINRIYRKTASGYNLLFKADYAQEIEFRGDYTKGYRNLYPAVYMYSTFTSVLYVYQYDGQAYKWDHCEMRFYVYGKWDPGKRTHGPVRFHRRPDISWVGCNPIKPYS